MNQTTHSPQIPWGNKEILFLASIATTIFFTIGIYLMNAGHLHEDAYILYIYSEMLSETGEISYFSGGARTEGATDFLWMVLIAGFNSIGVNSGLAALLLNSVSIFVLTLLAIRVGCTFGKSKIASLIIAIIIPFYTTSQAGYAGFSVALYSALIASLFIASITARGTYVAVIPVLALILALFRPDGAIIGLATCTLIIPFLVRAERKQFFRTLAACALVGSAYFIWRWQYFGEYFPLPLIVKSHADTPIPGLTKNASWISNNIYFASLSIASVFFLNNKIRSVTMALPVFLYMIAIAFAVQSQNIGMRFQAPLASLFIFGAAITLHFLLDRNRLRKSKAGLVLLATLIPLSVGQLNDNTRHTLTLLRYLTNDDYINFFPFHLSSETPANSGNV